MIIPSFKSWLSVAKPLVKCVNLETTVNWSKQTKLSWLSISLLRMTSWRMSSLITLLAVSLLSLPTVAQQTDLQQNDAPAVDDESFMVNMRQADIRAFIQWVADRTNKNILLHRNVKGSVTVISNRPVTRAEAYELFLTILQLNGFAAVDIEGGVKVIPDADAKTSDLPFYGQENNRGSNVTALIDIEHSDASELLGLLRPLMPATSHLAVYPPTNTLIVTATAASMEKINRIIKILDKAEHRIDLEIIPIIHASAEDIASTLKDVMKALSGGQQAKQKPEDDVQFSVDKRSNSLLITGVEAKRQQIRKLVAKLDTPLEGDGNTKVVYLNYIEASEISPILKSVGDSILKDNKTEDRKNFSIESSEATNALIITAPPALLSTMQSVIGKLDIQRAQVLIEAVVVQVTGDAGEDFGFIYGGAEIYEDNPDGAVAAVVVPSSNTDFTSLAPTVTTSGSNISTTSNLAAGVLSSSGLTFGYLEDGNLIAALRAIASKNKSNIMSTPTIVALDNEEASLLVGQNVPFITGSSTSSGATTANPFQTIQRQDIGITLNVTPRINQGDSITLEIEQTTENVSQNTTSGAADLITEKTEIKTSALIRDGQILVLGGLIREDEVQNRTQVPVLGSIPILGRAFRSSSVSKRKNNLMVFIRPVILKDQLQISGLTAQRYAFMRERQMQNALDTFIKNSDLPLLPEFESYSPQNGEAGTGAETIQQELEQGLRVQEAIDNLEEAVENTEESEETLITPRAAAPLAID